MLSFGCTGKTLIVGRQAFASIKSALQAADKGDTILVEKGHYKEQNIIISKPVVLRGIDYPVLDGENRFEILSVKAAHVTIEGFRLQNSGRSGMNDPAAVKIYQVNKVSIINNILYNNYFGIYVQYGVNCLIKNNRLSAYGSAELLSGNGIHCWKSDSLQITANTITGHRDGIYFEFVTNSLIWRNNSTGNIRYGLHFMFSHNDAYVANTFRDNGAGVAVMYSRNVKMFNNYFTGNWGEAAYGLLLKDISDSYIKGNHFEQNTTGINMEGSNRIQIEKNSFYQNGWAVKIQASCDNNNLQHNNFISNTFDIGTNGSLVLNTFNRNYWSRYEGYDLNKDRIGDVPFRPVSIFSMIAENNPPAMMLFRSFMVDLLDKTERLLPGITPELKDDFPLMLPLRL